MTADPAYGLAPPGSLPTRIARHQRRRMMARFLDSMGIAAPDSVLDVGVTRDRSHDHSNYFEAWYPHRSGITAAGVHDASFDFVHSSAVIGHVGSRERQAALLRELWRVARKGLCVTTPNRWFPIEVHTVLPLVHYLPPPAFRRVLAGLGHDF